MPMKPPPGPTPAPDGLIIRSTPFTGDDSRRLARYERLEHAKRQGRALLRARTRFVGATGGRPRRVRGSDE